MDSWNLYQLLAMLIMCYAGLLWKSDVDNLAMNIVEYHIWEKYFSLFQSFRPYEHQYDALTVRSLVVVTYKPRFLQLNSILCYNVRAPNSKTWVAWNFELEIYFARICSSVQEVYFQWLKIQLWIIVHFNPD